LFLVFFLSFQEAGTDCVKKAVSVNEGKDIISKNNFSEKISKKN